jgi:holo-[acyl-carrier protein] synthase
MTALPQADGVRMIVGTGIDIVEVRRVAAAIERHGDRFVQRIFTDAEIRYCESKMNRMERFAARFAAKEAGLKAIGTGWRCGVAWRELEVRRESSGRPTIVFSGKAGEFAAGLGMQRAFLSMSHTVEYAIAHVILEK